MATYYDKKKIIDENKDIYISDYDKSLSPEALSKIVEQKKIYKSAEESGDNAKMKEANQKANNIRMTYGNYDGGNDGSKYNPNSNMGNADYEIRNFSDYNSPYDSQMKDILKKIESKKSFSYNYENDPAFKAYYSLYQKLGDEAYERALSENALRTGGMVSTSAISAASGAKNHYNSMISDKIPELYKDAYSRYNNEYERLYNMLEYLSKLDEISYSRYRDEIKDFESDRDYYYNKQKDGLNRIYDTYKTDSELEYRINRDINDINYKKEKDKNEMDYKKERDVIEDNREDRKISEQETNNRYKAIINLAKALYGKTPISSSVIEKLYSLLK